MLVMELDKVKKYLGERLLLDIDHFNVYTEDKIGIVGLNGSGKTTLLDIIAGNTSLDEGQVKFYGSWEYIKQLGGNTGEDFLSGGEKTMEKINGAFYNDTHMIMADEPTSNLSLKHIEQLQQKLKSFKGGLLIISHDRAILNEVCNKIIEIENGKITEFAGNYDFYREEKKRMKLQACQEYEEYAREKERLSARVDQIKTEADSMKKAPKRMGNSEARLVKNAIKERAKKVDQTAKIIEGRLNKLAEVKKPIESSIAKIDIQEGTKLFAKIAIEASGLTKKFGSRILFQDASFKITNGSKTALIGENGSGKTTLLKMIMDDEDGIKKAAALKAAYFSQDLSILDESKTIYDNVAEESALSQTVIRSVLSRMLFFREDVFKPVNVLSGGERVKVALAKIFCKDVNMLVLDEPNNYLDVHSMEALQGLIEDYEGTILIVSHDRSLIGLANRLLVVEEQKIISFNGTYEEYLSRKAEQVKPMIKNDIIISPEQRKNLLLQLENRAAQMMGQVSNQRSDEDEAAFHKEFMDISREIRELKSINK